ncbi:MAG TPA: Fe-S cluster assembly protein SufD [bacterium]|nr:Fe-S cluster assembly protein SufD [bacterium]HQG44362.1 Fe-S cluster assembly protein SufD [bacterium]HQI47140.1 Fe-S cluster assembly protein SufD [bacterium]HQJ63142.1 Fe-S cluster assembly protein SufD [bacterium]
MEESVGPLWPELHHRALEQAAASAPEFLAELRREALARFTAHGFPTLKQERWRFTDVSALGGSSWKRIAESPAPSGLPETMTALLEPSAYRLVFINGRLSPESRLPGAADSFSIRMATELRDGFLARVERRMRETAATMDAPFAQINTALAAESVVLTIPDRLTLLVPIEIVHYTDAPAAAVHPRVLLLMGERAEAQLLEVYGGSAGSDHFTNPLTDVVVGEASRLDHYILQNEGAAAYHISSTRATLGRDSRYTRWICDFGGRLVRHDLEVELADSAAEANLFGLYMPKKRQHIDHHTTLRHLQPHTFSRQLYKGVLQDTSHSVFNGRIWVAREAQHTDAIQHNKNLLLSDEALADSQPQLEIFADDVRCTHGGTIGQMDQEGLFYLQSRGIGVERARQIMVHAFAGEITESIRLGSLRERIGRMVHERLGREE